MGIFISGLNLNASTAGMAYNRQKKELNYNPREISSQILRTSKTTGALQVLVRARGKVGVLERCRATGQYDDNEVRTALAHAKRMVKCAKLKADHLKEEEQQKKRNASTDEEKAQQKAGEIKRRIKTKKQARMQKVKLEMKKMEQAQQMKTREEALRQVRQRHRNKEREEIVDAEMKYLQGDTADEMERQPYFDSAAYAGVILEAGVQLADLEIQREIEQEMAMEMAADMAASGGALDIAALDSAAAVQAADAGAQAAADVSIDILV